MSRNLKIALQITSATVLAAGAGLLAATAIAQIGGEAPTTTTTVNQSPGPPGETGPASTVPGPPGETGPAGPKGDPGEPGAQSCPEGSTFTEVVWNHPGGHVTGWICVKDE